MLDMQELFQFSLDRAQEIVLIFDEHGKIHYANAAAKELLEYREDIYYTGFTEIFPAEFWVTDSGFETKHDFSDQVKTMMAYRKNRTCFLVEAKIVHYPNRLDTYICLASDASRKDYYRKRLTQQEQETEAALKVKSQFIANVTHELRTPVNGILGNTRELAEIETDPAKRRLLRLVERGCNDMHAIINNILDFSKLEAGKFTLEKRKFHFRNMMEYVKSNHINKITEKGLEFFMIIAPDVPEYLVGDELRIVQILNNLLSNACKFTSVGKIVVEVVKTAQINHRVELFFMVIDSGIGIDKADQDKLFKSFSQVEASTSRKYGGTGLGLSISKQLVELMDGNIRVESEKGKGTAFSVHIWLELPEGEVSSDTEQKEKSTFAFAPYSFSDIEDETGIWHFGENDNLEEIKKNMSKLILSVEMENWEKAEMFMDTLKQLTQDAPREIKSTVLRLKMAVQKGDYQRTTAAFDQVKEAIDGFIGGNASQREG